MGKVKKKAKIVLSVDEIEAAILSCEQVDCPVDHMFTPGMYIREITMPAGLTLTSKIHKTEHPYFILQGKVKVWTEEEGTVIMQSPHKGITKPGTRRVLTTITDTVWITVHLNLEDSRDLFVIEKNVIEPHINPLITKQERSNECLD